MQMKTASHYYHRSMSSITALADAFLADYQIKSGVQAPIPIFFM